MRINIENGFCCVGQFIFSERGKDRTSTNTREKNEKKIIKKIQIRSDTVDELFFHFLLMCLYAYSVTFVQYDSFIEIWK